MKSEEVNFKKNFCEKYFDKGSYDFDVLNQVDVLLKDKNDNYILYIESKYIINNPTELRKARAQVVLTNKKQNNILSHIALVYMNKNYNNVLELIDCSDNSVMYNNDFNWKAEKASNPTKDAIDRINDRIKGKITIFKNEEIREFYKEFKKNNKTKLEITEKNFNVIYTNWKNEIIFNEEIKDEQDLINLFLVDMLNGTKYKKGLFNGASLFDKFTEDLISAGTNLNRYQIIYKDDNAEGIMYRGGKQTLYYTIKNQENYRNFWKKYRRPPQKDEFLKILERSSTLYSDKYRRDTGGEYTPICFVKKQNEILKEYYNLDEYIVFDPCCGVGNLENLFGKDFKENCYLSTLEQMDVDTCKIKGFENVIQYNYLIDKEQPKFKYKGMLLDINEICKKEHKKLMVIMNPPYQRKKGFKYDLSLEFFIKSLNLKPDVIVFYCKTEFLLRDVIKIFKDSKYKIRSHIFSNAKRTFKISEWSISQIIFDKEKGEEIIENNITCDRYEIIREKFKFIKTYKYDISRPKLIKEIEKMFNKEGQKIGYYSYLCNVLLIGNKGKETNKIITTENLKYCLLSKGINFNSHAKYFEWNNNVYRGKINDISEELFNDSIMFSLFYKNNFFTNKEGKKNYIMPFTAKELGCSKNDLNVLFYEEKQKDLFFKEKQFDFREFMKQFNFSKEAKDLYNSALKIFKYYHNNKEYISKDYNDSFYDVTNIIMGKDPSQYKDLETDKDKRLNKTRTTKGTKSFSRNNIKYVVNSKDLGIFYDFFDKRDILAKKINKQLVDSGLLLWERENIY